MTEPLKPALRRRFLRSAVAATAGAGAMATPMLHQLLFQDATRLHIKAAINGFVRHPQRLAFRMQVF